MSVPTPSGFESTPAESPVTDHAVGVVSQEELFMPLKPGTILSCPFLPCRLSSFGRICLTQVRWTV